MKSHSNFRLGAGNYLQPQLPTANMTDPDLGTERYSLFMHILSTHSGAWVLYTTEQHVCIYWTPPFDSRVLTFAARRRGRKRQAHGNLQLLIIIILYCKLPSTQLFSSSPSTCISRDMWIKWWCSVNSNMLFCHIQNPKPRNVCLKFAWTANTFPYRDRRPPCWLLVIAAVGNCRSPVNFKESSDIGYSDSVDTSLQSENKEKLQDTFRFVYYCCWGLPFSSLDHTGALIGSALSSQTAKILP